MARKKNRRQAQPRAAGLRSQGKKMTSTFQSSRQQPWTQKSSKRLKLLYAGGFGPTQGASLIKGISLRLLLHVRHFPPGTGDLVQLHLIQPHARARAIDRAPIGPAQTSDNV